MPPAKRKSTCRNSPLLDSLEQRLDLLTRTLSAADIAEKSIDIVKEIKELHAILRSLRDEASPELAKAAGEIAMAAIANIDTVVLRIMSSCCG